jgi:hypothetical protein
LWTCFTFLIIRHVPIENFDFRTHTMGCIKDSRNTRRY